MLEWEEGLLISFNASSSCTVGLGLVAELLRFIIFTLLFFTCECVLAVGDMIEKANDDDPILMRKKTATLAYILIIVH